MIRNTYILLDVLLCSIAEYFYELCRVLTSPKGKSKYKQRVCVLYEVQLDNKYILLDVLLCSIAEYCLTSPYGE